MRTLPQTTDSKSNSTECFQTPCNAPTSYPRSLLGARQLDGEGPGSGWSRGYLNYFVLGEGLSKETRLI